MKGIKAKRPIQIVLAGALVLLLHACAIYPRSGAPALVGTWTNLLGTVWTINRTGTFNVDLNSDGKRDAWGNYTVAGDTITIIDTGGTVPKGCKGDGVYHFSRTGADSLHFMLVKDRCKLRVKNATLTWHRK